MYRVHNIMHHVGLCPGPPTQITRAIWTSAMQFEKRKEKDVGVMSSYTKDKDSEEEEDNSSAEEEVEAVLFPQFALLPQELQDEIWRFALPSPRIIQLANKGLRTRYSNEPIPQCCRESDNWSSWVRHVDQQHRPFCQNLSMGSLDYPGYEQASCMKRLSLFTVFLTGD